MSSLLVIALLHTLLASSSSEHYKELMWTGGPLHMDCEYGADFFTVTGQHVPENVVAVKAVMHKEHIYVMTPRLKPGILSTVWLLVSGRRGPELQPFPDQRVHAVGHCNALQNAIDMQIDHLGNLWILDSGVVETTVAPRCTCPPKVVVLNLLLRRVVRTVDLAGAVDPSSTLHNIVVDHTLDGDYIYITDSSRGKIIVHDLSRGNSWSVLASTPANGLQTALIKRSPAHSYLALIRTPYEGVVELDTATLKRKHSMAPMTVYGESSKPVVLLGWDPHRVFLRHSCCGDVLSWDSRAPFNASRLSNIHRPPAGMVPSSAASAHGLRHHTVVLSTNHAHATAAQLPTTHTIAVFK